MLAWGSLLLARGGKVRAAAWERDLTLRTLGYSTDNGAYYYYNTAPNASYEQTMLRVAEYAAAARLPYRYWLADSWWYYKGTPARGRPGGGVTNWTARPDVFPRGFEALTAATGWRVQGHNRYWDATTGYARANGGRYSFLRDRGSGYALPVDAAFWGDLLRNASRWGLAVYEQDWLDYELDHFAPLTQSASLGGDWLPQMAAGAAASGVSIQYCMSYSRHVLASTQLPPVTQARASDDYQPGNDQWRPLGTTALFAYAVGLAPSKDSFWSTPVQPGAPRYRAAQSEPRCRLQAAVSTLSRGPVAPSDGIGLSDAALIMRSAAADGTLLSPARPATKLDAFLAADAFASDGAPTGEVWFADTAVSSRRFGVLLAARVSAATAVSQAQFGYAPGASVVAVEANSTHRFTRLGAGGLSLPPNGELDFRLWNLAPVERNGWALLGEVAHKWVGVSPARVTAVDASSSGGMEVAVRGAAGERVTMSFAPPCAGPCAAGGQPEATVSVACELPASGRALVRAPEGASPCAAL